MSNARFVVVTTTVSQRPAAAKLAREIVAARLAACVQIWPVASVYRWKGKLETGNEYALVCKTRAAVAARLQEFIRGRHTYEVPEIILSPIMSGLPAYLTWLAQETTPARQPPLTFPRPATKKAASRKGRKA